LPNTQPKLDLDYSELVRLNENHVFGDIKYSCDQEFIKVVIVPPTS